MSKRRDVLEKQRQIDVEADLGAEEDFLLMRNSVGNARYVADDGREYHVPYGVGGKGAPDLVGALRVNVAGIVIAIWIAFEVKADGGALSPDQVRCHAAWRRAGIIVETVHSAPEARAALERARARFAGKAVAA